MLFYRFYCLKAGADMIFILEDDDGIRNLVGYTLNNSVLRRVLRFCRGFLESYDKSPSGSYYT